MNIFKYYNSSIGCKQVMAITGLALCSFVLAHLAGNLLVFQGKAVFNGYAAFLHSHEGLVIAAEIGLLALALLHLVCAVQLVIGNWCAKPVSYKGGGLEPEYLASSTMKYTGPLVMIFIVIHLLDFKYNPHLHEGVYDVAKNHFVQLPYAAAYISFMVILGIHLFHGFQSTFLSLGLDHPKYTPWIKIIGYLYATAMAVGFAAIPAYFYFYQGGI